MNHPRFFPGAREVGDGLTASLERVARRQDRCDLRRTVSPGWLRCADLLADPGLFADWRGLLAEWLAAEYDVDPADVPERTTASYVATWYLHVPAYVGALLLHHERRVPALSPAELAFGLGGDRPHPEGLAVLGDDFYCLPTDPGSALPEATVVPDERTLAAVLRAHYVSHAARFVRTYAPTSRLGRRALWAAATDALDNGLWWTGREGGTTEAEGAGVADAALVLDTQYPPLTGPSALRLETSPDGSREWTRKRESCCYSYLLPEESECEGCPRLCGR